MRQVLFGAIALLTPELADSASLGSVNLELHVSVINHSCSVAVADQRKIVALGRWTTRDLADAGSHTSAVPFSVTLNNCPPSGPVTITFSGTPDTNDGRLLALNNYSTARNVAVELLDSKGNPLSLQATSNEVKASPEGEASFAFYARYRSPNGRVTAGSADADATLILGYE